jgi:hypothetical protein
MQQDAEMQHSLCSAYPLNLKTEAEISCETLVDFCYNTWTVFWP